MADLEELSQYVASHPDDYTQRWRLAKKLYMAWEYNEAIKHLLILKKNWTRKLNVLRYLAATYYRLGRYMDSISELKEILQQWPSETAVWEQLARVYEVADQSELAAQAWEHVLRLDPNHPIAGRAVARLRSTRPVTPSDNLRLTDSDSGIHINRGIVCPSCGAQNSAEFERCWQCHGVLHQSSISDDDMTEIPPAKAAHWGRTLVGGLATVAALSLAVHLSMNFLNSYDSATAPKTVYAVLAQSLFSARLGTCVALLIVSPVLLWLALRLSRAPIPPGLALPGTSLFLACAYYDLMWAPAQYLLFAPAAAALVSLAAVALMQKLSTGRLLRVWLIQGAGTLLLALVAFSIQAGYASIVELPQIAKAAGAADTGERSGAFVLGKSEVPKTWRVTWATTGSKWLDAQAAAATFEIVAAPQSALLGVELRQGGRSIYYADAPPYRFTAPIVPKVEYEIAVTGSPDSTADLTVYGLLEPRAVI